MTEMKAPTIAFQVIFSWKSQYEGRRMMMGVIEVVAEKLDV